MAEEKKKQEFQKSRFLTIDEVKALVNDYLQLKLHDMEAGTAFVAKIVAPVEEKEIPGFDNAFIIPCEYKHKSLETPAKITIQAGENAIKRLKEKNPEGDYVGKYAVFSKTKTSMDIEGKSKVVFPQFINIMEGEPKDREDKNEAFKAKINDTPQTAGMDKVLMDEVWEDFKSDYFATMAENNVKPSQVHMIGAYVGTYEKDAHIALIAACGKAMEKKI